MFKKDPQCAPADVVPTTTQADAALNDLDSTYNSACRPGSSLDAEAAAAVKLITASVQYSGELSLRIGALGLECRANHDARLVDIGGDPGNALGGDEVFANMITSRTSNPQTAALVADAVAQVHAAQHRFAARPIPTPAPSATP